MPDMSNQDQAPLDRAQGAAEQPQAAPRRRRRIPVYVWVICAACAVWLCMALYGQLIRDGLIADPVAEKAKAAAEAAQIAAAAPKRTEPGGAAISDMDRPVEVKPPVDASQDRGEEILSISSRRCGMLDPSYQAKVLEEGKCEVFLHELARQDQAILIMASPRYGVRPNGRPIITMLPESAYPKR